MTDAIHIGSIGLTKRARPDTHVTDQCDVSVVVPIVLISTIISFCAMIYFVLI